MDTRGKTNAEFRNDVTTTLARHEARFDQVNAALQAVLTELQALCHSRNQVPANPIPTHLLLKKLLVQMLSMNVPSTMSGPITTSSWTFQGSTARTQPAGFTSKNNILISKIFPQTNKFS